MEERKDQLQILNVNYQNQEEVYEEEYDEQQNMAKQH